MSSSVECRIDQRLSELAAIVRRPTAYGSPSPLSARSSRVPPQDLAAGWLDRARRALGRRLHETVAVPAARTRGLKRTSWRTLDRQASAAALPLARSSAGGLGFCTARGASRTPISRSRPFVVTLQHRPFDDLRRSSRRDRPDLLRGGKIFARSTTPGRPCSSRTRPSA